MVNISIDFIVGPKSLAILNISAALSDETSSKYSLVLSKPIFAALNARRATLSCNSLYFIYYGHTLCDGVGDTVIVGVGVTDGVTEIDVVGVTLGVDDGLTGHGDSVTEGVGVGDNPGVDETVIYVKFANCSICSNSPSKPDIIPISSTDASKKIGTWKVVVPVNPDNISYIYLFIFYY